jgi:Family of unknown function (DUF5681)
MNTESEAASTEPNKSGLRPWRKGQSGNPHGRRPKGLATVEKLRAALVKDLPAILEVVVKNALAGDITAAKTILERVLPPLKAVEVPAYLEEFTGSLSEQGQQILQAMAAGSLSPGQAVQVLGAVAAQAKIVEVDEFARRLELLEKRLGAANGHA